MKRSYVKNLTALCVSVVALSVASAQGYKGVFKEADMKGIKVGGWLKRTLETQRNGLMGNPDVMHGPFTTEGWGAPVGERKMNHWAQYEQTGYWADGALRASYLIDDPALGAEVKKWIAYQMDSAGEDGFIGPREIANLWPEVVFFRVMMAEYTATGDRKILDALAKNYRGPQYADLIQTGHEFAERMMLHVEIMCWLYGKTGDRFFLDKAEETYANFNKKYDTHFTLQSLGSNDIPRTHSVSYCENLKIPAILYNYTGKQGYLDAAENAVRKIYKYYGLVDGLPSGNEFHDGNFTNEVHETCTASDMQWALGYLLMATGDVYYADLMEKICFNAAMGSVTKDFKSFQYYSGPNQVIANRESSHWNCHESYHEFGKIRCSFRTEHGPACCSGNHHRMLPVYASRMWMEKDNDGAAAALYGPSVFEFTPGGQKQKVTIVEETNYPFDETIKFKVGTKNAVGFSLWLRIPDWCESASITINRQPSGIECKSGRYVEVKRKYRNADVVELTLPMKPQVIRTPENGMAIQYGSLLYSYPVPEKSEIIETRTKDGVEYPSYNLTPAGKWNYGISSSGNIRVVKNDNFSDPWNPESTPVKLEVDAQEITNWGLYRGVYTPQMPTVFDMGEQCRLTLVPLGATTLRMTIFPELERVNSSSSK